MHLLAVVHLVHALIGEDVLLCVEIVIVVPLCRRTSHHTYVMLLGERVVKEEIIVPKIRERLVVALVSAAFLHGRRLPVVLGCKAVIIPELGVQSERALQLEPLRERHLCRDVAEKIISLGAAMVGSGGSDWVSHAAVPKRVALRSCPFAVLVLDGKDGQSLVCAAQVVAALLLAVGRHGDVGSHLEPRQHLRVSVLLEGEASVLYASHDARLVEHAA